MIRATIADGPFRTLRYSSLSYVVFHRLSLSRLPEPIADANLTGELVIDAFKDRILGTGGKPPYHALIRADAEATVDQMLPLDACGAHARGYNGTALAVAIVGLLDEHAMTAAQYSRAVDVGTQLALYKPGHLQVVGHTELPGASKDPNKRCPGRMVSMHALRTQIEYQLSGWCADGNVVEVERAGWTVSTQSPRS